MQSQWENRQDELITEMNPTPISDGLAKFLSIVKDLPVWILMAFAAAASILLFSPQIKGEIPKDSIPWIIIFLVVFGMLSLFRWIDILTRFLLKYRSERDAHKTFHMTPAPQHCLWSVAKQRDSSLVTQIVAHFSVKNRSLDPIGLMQARVIKPKIRGKIIHDMIIVREQHGRMYGSAEVSGCRIAPGALSPAQILILIRGVPRLREDQDMSVVFEISDEDGRKQRVKAVCQGIQNSDTST